MYLIILHPDNKNYRRFQLNHLPDVVEGMLECRKAALKKNLKEPVYIPVEDMFLD
jgi:hypothetical protein